MTRSPEQSERRQPGRELDEMIAERVMGDAEYDVVIEGCSRAGPYATREDAEAGKPRLAERYLVGATVLASRVPAYSTDIAAACDIVDAMCARDWLFVLDSQPSWATRAWGAQFDRNDGRVFREYGDTPAHAICLAALAALDTADGIPAKAAVLDAESERGIR